MFSWFVRRTPDTFIYVKAIFGRTKIISGSLLIRRMQEAGSKVKKMYPCYYPTNRSLKALIKNTKIAWNVLHKEKPDLIISCGAAVAVPFFYIGKMMGAKLVYIEVF